MKKLIQTFLCGLIFSCTISAQLVSSVKGNIVDYNTKRPLSKVKVVLKETSISQLTNTKGDFILTRIPEGNLTLQISLSGYETQLFPITIGKGEELNLGIISLSHDLSDYTLDSGLISLTEVDLNDDDGRSENIAGLLQSSKDVFQNRAAFDWGPSFFRIRGYDSQHASVLINGVSMNKLSNGRPDWNNWGGLNDATRNQELTTGLAASNYTFGGLVGTTNVSTRASLYRPGIRISSSYSNRSYTGRGMVTYNSGLQKKGFAYSISASRRWGNEGFVNGTLYDAFGFFGALEYRLNDHHSVNATAIYAPNRRGQAAAITERVFNELGRKYNPYWGVQDGYIRNSRVREIAEPILMFSHFFETEKTTLSTSMAYQLGRQGRSRIDYMNAPNPNPNYWRYLPNIAQKPQIDWNSFYEANVNSINIDDAGVSRYLLYEDRTDDDLLTLNSILNIKLTPNLTMDIGSTYKSLTSENFGNPVDLLGAQYYSDTNQFTLINGRPSRNDVLGEVNKGLDDRIKYNYTIFSTQINTFAQLQFNFKKADFFISGSYTTTNYQREGLFLNESFEDNSLGKSEPLTFADTGIKGGITYKITGRHLVNLSAGYLSKAPTIRNAFVNSRENNTVVPDLTSEKIIAGEASYILRLSKLKARITGYFTEFKEGTDINFFFAQGGSGTDFFQEAVTDIGKRHLGIELGLEYRASSTVKVFAAAAVGQHTYTGNANVSINFDTAGFNEDLINEIGFKNLGEAHINGLRIANGPQQSYSIGIEYKDPKFWWIGATTNYLSNAYVDISTISRTNDFFINPEDPFGFPFEEIDLDLAKQLLKQEEFQGYYLLNLTGGKSWRIKGNYISLFVSIHNAFDETYRTGGFEQSRTANYADLVEDNENGAAQRNFGNKYWYGRGRTYFINLVLNF